MGFRENSKEKKKRWHESAPLRLTKFFKVDLQNTNKTQGLSALPACLFWNGWAKAAPCAPLVSKPMGLYFWFLQQQPACRGTERARGICKTGGLSSLLHSQDDRDQKLSTEHCSPSALSWWLQGGSSMQFAKECSNQPEHSFPLRVPQDDFPKLVSLISSSLNLINMRQMLVVRWAESKWTFLETIAWMMVCTESFLSTKHSHPHPFEVAWQLSISISLMSLILKAVPIQQRCAEPLWQARLGAGGGSEVRKKSCHSQGTHSNLSLRYKANTKESMFTQLLRWRDFWCFSEEAARGSRWRDEGRGEHPRQREQKQ